eukprot:Gb_17237 [translate_table: standard]
MHKSQCINHDSRTSFKVGLLGIRYTTSGQGDVHPGRTSRSYQPNLGHHKGSPSAPSTWVHTPVAGRVPRLAAKVRRPSITKEEPQPPLGTGDHQLSRQRPKGFPSYGSLGFLQRSATISMPNGLVRTLVSSTSLKNPPTRVCLHFSINLGFLRLRNPSPRHNSARAIIRHACRRLGAEDNAIKEKQTM